MTSPDSPWTSLEIMKLMVACLTPLLVLVLTVVVARANRRRDEIQGASRRAVDLLIDLHTKMAPLINDLYCFFLRVGHFREIDPPGAVVTKRKLDRLYYTNESLFSDDFRYAYKAFTDACFNQRVGAGIDAQLRTSARDLERERGSAGWQITWNTRFEPEPPEAEARQAKSKRLKKEQSACYKNLMETFANQLGLSPRHRAGRQTTTGRGRRSGTTSQPGINGSSTAHARTPVVPSGQSTSGV